MATSVLITSISYDSWIVKAHLGLATQAWVPIRMGTTRPSPATATSAEWSPRSVLSPGMPLARSLRGDGAGPFATDLRRGPIAAIQRLAVLQVSASTGYPRIGQGRSRARRGESARSARIRTRQEGGLSRQASPADREGAAAPRRRPRFRRPGHIFPAAQADPGAGLVAAPHQPCSGLDGGGRGGGSGLVHLLLRFAAPSAAN